jgi:hypothetical protein
MNPRSAIQGKVVLCNCAEQAREYYCVLNKNMINGSRISVFVCSKLLEDGYFGEFANTFGVRSPFGLVQTRVGNPGLQLANAFGVNHQVPSYKIPLCSVSMNPHFFICERWGTPVKGS